MRHTDEWPDLVSRQGCPDLNSRWPREDPPGVASESAAAAGPTRHLGTVSEVRYLQYIVLALFLTRKTVHRMSSCVGTRFCKFLTQCWQNYVVLPTILHTLTARSKYLQVTNLTSGPRGIHIFHKATKLLYSSLLLKSKVPYFLHVRLSVLKALDPSREQIK